MNSTIFDTYLAPADPVSLPIISSPPLTLLIVGFYTYFVLKLGREFMEHRKPYDVRKAMLIYNFIQIIYNGILFGYSVYYLFIIRAYDWRCMDKLPMDNPRKNTERFMTYAFFLNKILDLMDTVFFVLRKSYKQITVLHVYHHVLMVAGIPFMCIFYGPGGQNSTLGCLNTLIHTLMYSYYFWTALNPKEKGILWWKKNITKLQLLQFTVLFFQALLMLIFNPSCTVPPVLHVLQMLVSTSMILMFSNFYYHAYIKVKKMKQT